MTIDRRGKSALGAFVQSPLGVFGQGESAPPPSFGAWEVSNLILYTAPGAGVPDQGYRIADCATGTLAAGDYKSVVLTAKTLADVFPGAVATGGPLHALGVRSGYVYTFDGNYLCNYINGPSNGNAPRDLPGSGEFKPYNAWELLEGTTDVGQAYYNVPRITDRDSHADNEGIDWFDATLIPNPDDLIDLSAPWTCTGLRTIPANTPGPGNVGRRVGCTLDVFPEEMWGINLQAVSPGYIGWASFYFRNLRWVGQTNGFTYDHDNRPDLENRYKCPGRAGAFAHNVLDVKYPSFPTTAAFPYEDIFGIGGAGDARIDDVEIIIPKSAQPTQPLDLGETVLWEFQP